MLDELLTIAMIGTARGGTAVPPLPDALADAANAITDPTPEQKLLTQTALLTCYVRAGQKPATAGVATGVAESDSLPACSARAADLLADLLRGNEKPLIAEWLTAAARSGRRAAHRLLPALLDFVRKEKTLRQAAIAVVDQRGRWLMTQNPDWRFTAADDLLDEALWETGTLEQRTLLLRQVRQTDPTRAHALLQKTAKDDPADQRTEFLKLLQIGLSLADEPFLESMLDDRSKQVRSIAADLLGRLPQSQLVQRMIARATPLMLFKKGLLRGWKLEVTLPSELDKSAVRDSVEKAPPQGTGEKQWWLRQMLSFVPLSTWTNATGAKPTEIIRLCEDSEYAAVLFQAFLTAAERQPEQIWSDALIRHSYVKVGTLPRALIDTLAENLFSGLAIDILRDQSVTLRACSDLIINNNAPLSPATAKLWVETVSRLANTTNRMDHVVLYDLPRECAMRLPISVRPQIESNWLTEIHPWPQYRKSVEKLLSVLDIRQQIAKEFA